MMPTAAFGNQAQALLTWGFALAHEHSDRSLTLMQSKLGTIQLESSALLALQPEQKKSFSHTVM